MSIPLGLNCKLYRNTGTYATPVWDEITGARDVAINLNADEADVTTRGGGGWKAILQSLNDASLDVEIPWDSADADMTAIRSAFIARTSIEVAAMDGDISVSGAEGFRATVAITKFERSEPLNGPAMVSITLKPTVSANAPEWYVVP